MPRLSEYGVFDAPNMIVISVPKLGYKSGNVKSYFFYLYIVGNYTFIFEIDN